MLLYKYTNREVMMMEEKKKAGRPKNEINFKKRTLMIDDRLYKALQIKAVTEERDVSEIIRDILNEQIEPKYFIEL